MVADKRNTLGHLVFTVLILLACNTSLANHKVTSDMSHGDWHSLVVNMPSAVFARAITMHVGNEGQISTFNIDSPASNCSSVFFTVNINLSELQEQDIKSPTLFGKFRVDKQTVHDITYTLNIERGEDYISLYISDWSRKGSVLKEIMSGSTARFQFKIDAKSYYYRFSLQGSREALERQDQICRKFDQDDEDYFNQPEEEDDDAVYFST